METKESLERLSDLAAHVGQALEAQGLVLATAESCTGGWIAKLVTDRAGSSAWFDRGFVTYSNEAKQEMLGVSEATLSEHGAVSEAVVREMAHGALDNSRAGISVSVSVVAGPGGGSPEKPVGTVWLAWATKDGMVTARRELFGGDRDVVRRRTAESALRGILEMLDHA